ncbi:MAG: aminoglycoside phosphotransferase family protein [Anaerolineae bacterium]|nr:aminoglycoside phosphotransferase family protein [Anaerolineae bacterium]
MPFPGQRRQRAPSESTVGLEALSEPERARLLHPLLERLSRGESAPGWEIARITGGANNLLYRATGPLGDLAVKFTLADPRDRAGREYTALLALHRSGLRVAPVPLLLDRSSYSLPVVVQTWLEGEVSKEPPADDGEWTLLLKHLAAVHSLSPADTDVEIRPAHVTAPSAEAAVRLVREQAERIPEADRPALLSGILDRLEARDLPRWPTPEPRLCRADANITNFIRRPGGWCSVDWENSGWGDPAFEIADLITHPAYLGVPCQRWQWVAHTYCELAGDGDKLVRIWAYYGILLCFWVARLARYLYEVPRGLDPRLVELPANWERDRLRKYRHYRRLAAQWLDVGADHCVRPGQAR